VDMELNVTSRDDLNLVLRYKLSMQSFRQAGPRGIEPPCVLADFLGLAGRPDVDEASSFEQRHIRHSSTLRRSGPFRPLSISTADSQHGTHRIPLTTPLRVSSTMPATAMLDPLLLGAMHTDMDTIIVSIPRLFLTKCRTC
jgi:hypothetical protein